MDGREGEKEAYGEGKGGGALLAFCLITIV